MKTYKVNDNLFLTAVPVNLAKDNVTVVQQNANHLFVCDCSGSMSYDLPKIREQLKRRLPKLLAEGDTISIVWFSGRGQFGTLCEAEPVATLTDLSDLEKAIDRWLKPCGLTGFKEPLEEVGRVVTRVTKLNKNPFALCFMSDGCDNQWSRNDVLSAVEKAAPGLASATFVEYGYYADRPLLSAMAEKAGGSLIFAADFDQYSPQFEAVVTRQVTGKKVSVNIPGDTVGGFAYTTTGDALTTYGIDNGSVNVPENTEYVYFLAPKPPTAATDTINTPDALPAAYAALSLFSMRGNSNVVFALLKTLGDVYFISKFGSCFGKQKYTEFMEETKAAVYDKSKRLQDGYDPDKVPADDAFTLLDLLSLLQADPETRLLLDDKEFKYTRIGRGRIEEPDALKFEAAPAPDGYPINGLVFTEDRPNISIRVTRHGTVNLGDKMPAKFAGNKVGSVPLQFPTYTYRNYTVVKDGLVNVEKLPLKTGKDTFAKIAKVANVSGNNNHFTVNLSSLPIINRQMVKDASAKSLFETKLKLLKAQAAQKVYNSYQKELFPGEKTQVFSALYGEEAANWLKEQGITANGFNPPSTQAPATDVYMAKELKASIKGFSSLPSLKDVQDKIKTGKVTPAAGLMVPYVTAVEAARSQSETFSSWLAGRVAEATKESRELILERAKATFTLVVGQVWPSEFASINDTDYKLTHDGKTYDCKLEMKEVQVSL